MNKNLFADLDYIEQTQTIQFDQYETKKIYSRSMNQKRSFVLNQSIDLKKTYNTKATKNQLTQSNEKCLFTEQSRLSFLESSTSSKTFEQVSQSHGQNFRKLNPNDNFKCKCCMDEKCQYCQGKIYLTGNDKIIKFFQFILQFKVGMRQMYKPQKYKPQKKSNTKLPVNQHCNIYFSQNRSILQSANFMADSFGRLSLGSNAQRIVSRKQHEEKIKNIRQIHCGYDCDQCEVSPIVGARYHCQECGDFDLCQNCYCRNSHQHEMRKIQLKNNHKVLEKVSNLMKSQIGNSFKLEIKNTCSKIRNTFNSKIYKSSIH